MEFCVVYLLAASFDPIELNLRKSMRLKFKDFIYLIFYLIFYFEF